MLGAERVDWEPDVGVRAVAELAEHGGIALVRADDHAAEEEQDGAAGWFFRGADDQAREVPDHFLFIVHLAVCWQEKAAAAICLFDGVQQLFLRQRMELFRAGELVDGMDEGCAEARTAASFPFTISFTRCAHCSG